MATSPHPISYPEIPLGEDGTALAINLTARILDKIRPSWWLRIDTDILVLSHVGRCIAGQLGEEWETLALEAACASREICQYDAEIAFSNGTDIWKQEILTRLGG